ncbi:putative AraC family transcriptional regulator [Caenibius tardaugens NBRC 16725]|uniref:Putative AraC family transcriptional regulator n=1 Tax=Caenibius tardaugens NBRC 16725 TaxID=1219035 RepID=U2YHV2_9SPHN|nr:AraC family transcriptional regulator [Caenibius tardaugens]GAD47547.1 putative AraC family transcriptional regulator [Caenibius tardaugens NBRC 16725]
MNEYAVAQADAVAFQHSLRKAYGTFDTTPISARASGSATAVDCPALPGVAIQARNVSSQRTALDERWNDTAFILVVLGGSLDLDHYGLQTTLDAGDMALLDAREACRIDVTRSAHALTLCLARSDVIGLRTTVENIFGIPISGQRSIGRILAGTITAIVREKCEQDLVCGIRSAVMSLIDQSLDSELTLRGHSDCDRALLREMAEWVLHNPEAIEDGVGAMAHQFGMSRRSLFRLFSRYGTSPTRWITDIRLGYAYRRLVNGGGAETVTTVAYEAGFSDSSQFARAFRQRFGMAPSACRDRTMIRTVAGGGR